MATKKLKQSDVPVHIVPAMFRAERVGVTLVGCGGNGSMMLARLARLDYALRACGLLGMKVVVFDPDLVSPSNVGRQNFSSADIGLAKSIVCVHRVNAFYGLDWGATPELFAGYRAGEAPRNSERLLITCVDSAKARRDIANRMDGSAPRYWLDLGNERLHGQVVLGQPENSLQNKKIGFEMDSEDFRRNGLNGVRRPLAARLPTVVEMFPEILDAKKKESDTPTCSVAEALDRQSLFVNDLMAGYAAQILDNLFRIGHLEYHGVFINLENGRANPMPVPLPQAIEKAA